MKYLAIDYGQKRVGIAVSDAGGHMAFPKITLERGEQNVFFRKLLDLIAEEKADAVILGLPFNLDNEETEAGARVRTFAKRLSEHVAQPIYLVNEALTSFAAEEDLKEAGLNAKRRAEVLDQQAAVHILETFMNTPTYKQVKYEP